MEEFIHEDKDGDMLRIRTGDLGVIIEAVDHDLDRYSVMVAVRFAQLPGLIDALQVMLGNERAS